MGVSWGLLCPISWGLVDELVDSEPEERSESEESFVLDFTEGARPPAKRKGDDRVQFDMVQFVQAIEDYSNEDARASVFKILMNCLNGGDLEDDQAQILTIGLMLQRIVEYLPRTDREVLIQTIERFLNAKGQTQTAQIFEKDYKLVEQIFKMRYALRELNPLPDDLKKLFLEEHFISYARKDEVHFILEEQLNQMPNFREIVQKIRSGRDAEMQLHRDYFEVIREQDRSPKQRLQYVIIMCNLHNPEIALQKVKSIVEEGNVNVNSICEECLLLAATAGRDQNGGLEIVRFFLDNGANIEIADGLGRTALHEAALHGNTEVVRLLIARGANINAKDDNGWTPADLAWAYDHLETVELFISNEAEINPQILAWAHDHPEAMAPSINNEAEIDPQID
jgi:hypothetical protein